MKNLFVIFFALAISFPGCKKEDPVPVIEVFFLSDVTGEFAPCTVEFYSLNEGDNYQWSFDGQAPNSVVKNPVVTFSTPGTYNITLKVSGIEGAGEVTKTVTIPPKATHCKINSVVLTQYPMQKSTGVSWDPSPYYNPDIYFTLLGVQPTFPVLYKHTAKMQDVSSMKNITFTIPDGIVLPIVEADYSIVVYDWDDTSSEFMGRVSFDPMYHVTKLGYYPASFSGFTEGTGAIFNVTWQ